MQLETKRVTSPQISPAGSRIVFEVAHADLESDRWVRRLHSTSLDAAKSDSPLSCEACWGAQWGGNDGTPYVLKLDDEGHERVHSFDLSTGALGSQRIGDALRPGHQHPHAPIRGDVMPQHTVCEDGVDVLVRVDEP